MATTKGLIVNPKDYLIIEEAAKKKKFLVQTTSTKNDKVEVVLDDASRRNKETQHTFLLSRSSVVANLGPNPTPGTAYGVRVEPWRKTIEHDIWGDIHFFTKLPDEHESAFLRAVDTIISRMHNLGLMQGFPIETHVRPGRGKYAGSYSTRSGKKKDLMQLHPKQWGNRKAVELLLWHELGHYLEAHYFTKKIYRMWIRSYHNNVTLQRTTPDDLEELREELIKSKDWLADFGKSLDDERTPIWDAIIRWIEDYHALKPKHIDILIDGGDNLTDFWPKDPVHLSDFAIPVTEYGNKNPSELFCESFCYHMTGKELPDGRELPENMAKLVDKTLDRLTA